jgi:hypothetical protein
MANRSHRRYEVSVLWLAPTRDRTMMAREQDSNLRDSMADHGVKGRCDIALRDSRSMLALPDDFDPSSSV